MALDGTEMDSIESPGSGLEVNGIGCNGVGLNGMQSDRMELNSGGLDRTESEWQAVQYEGK